MNGMPEDERLLTLKEAMARLRVSRSTILRMIEKRELVAHKVGNSLRFYERDLKNAVRTIDASEVRNQKQSIDTERN